MVDPGSFTACHPGIGLKWTTLQVTGQQKSEAIHLMSTGGLSNGQLRTHSFKQFLRLGYY